MTTYTTTSRSYAEPSVRGSSSMSFDYTGSDLIAKLLEEEGGLESARQGALYDGDIKTSLQAGDRIRRLRGLRSGIAPVRVRSIESSSGREGAKQGYDEKAPDSLGYTPEEKEKPKKG